MEHAQHARSAKRRPIQETRLKREARRLADWTGRSLAESQEITARAFGSTSWQAILKDPTFVPDEELADYPYTWSAYGDRYADLQSLLSARLHISKSQAHLLASIWQPTALRASPTLWLWSAHQTEHDDWRIIHSFGEHPALTAGVSVVLACKPIQSPASLQSADTQAALLAIRSDQCGWFATEEATAPLRTSAGIEKLIDYDWQGAYSSARIAKLLRELGKPKSVAYGPAGPPTQGAPSTLRARWLHGPIAEAELFALASQHMPWRLEDYPGIKKNDAHTFWALQTPQLLLTTFFAPNGTIFMEVYTSESRSYAHSHVQVGVGGLRYLEPTGPKALWRVSTPGYYLVKYGNQTRSPDPIPNMDHALASRVQGAVGLGGAEDSPVGFFNGEAGLALARWAATFPKRAARLDCGNSYTGNWLTTVKRRLEFELIRAGLLD